MTRALSLALIFVFSGAAAAITPEQVSIPEIAREPEMSELSGMTMPQDLAGSMRKIDSFIQRTPRDGEPPTQRTELFIGYTRANLIAIFFCYDNEPDAVRAHLTTREQFSGDDTVTLQLDTFNDRQRAYTFIVNPYGQQQDSIWTDSDGSNSEFDTMWDSSATRTDQGYVVMMKIPFKSLRFDSSSPTFGFMATRQIGRHGEIVAWPAWSEKIQSRLGQMGAISGMNEVSPGRNMQFIPYMSGERRTDALGNTNEFNGGLDAKFVLQDKIVVDVTANPDFSQVEIDTPQTTVNQRFALFFPEKRPFFLENAALFETPLNAVFTRTIADPNGGVRATGNIGQYDFGMMFVDDEQEIGRADRIGIGRLIRNFSDRSNLGMMFTTREGQFGDGTAAGVDSRIVLNANWTATLQALGSWRSSPTSSDNGASYYAQLARGGQTVNYSFRATGISRNFDTPVGFTPRTDIHEFNNFLDLTWRTPKSKWLHAWGPGFNTTGTTDFHGKPLDGFHETYWGFIAHKNTVFVIGRRDRVEAPEPTMDDPRHLKTGEWRFNLNSGAFKWFGTNTTVLVGNRVNFSPPTGMDAFKADSFVLQSVNTIRPFSNVVGEVRYLSLFLSERETGERVVDNQIIQTKWNVQLTPRWGIRAIGTFQTTKANAALSAVPSAASANFDLLVTYLMHPGTAFYFGYNSDRSGPKFGDFGEPRNRLFAKASYLFRF